MTDDYKVDGWSAKEIASITLAWRYTLGVADQWAPSVVSLLELRLPKIVKNFALVVRPDPEMGDAEAYTEFDPPHIAVRGSVYAMAQREDGRSRMHVFDSSALKLTLNIRFAQLRSVHAHWIVANIEHAPNASRLQIREYLVSCSPFVSEREEIGAID